MEVVGVIASALTLAALFKKTVQAFDLIELYQNQDADLRKLQFQLKMEKCRLYVWGETMGFTDASVNNVLDSWPFVDIVTECLAQIVRLFSDVEKLSFKYGCQEVTVPNVSRLIDVQRETFNSRSLAVAFNNFTICDLKIGRKISVEVPTVLRKTKWIIRDRKKFNIFLLEVKGLITGLQDITQELSSAARQEKEIQARIMGIRDVETLNLVAAACEKSHPQLASAASTQADHISMSSGRILDIVEWQTQIDDEQPKNLSITNLEELTVTELKHSLANLIQQQAEQSELVEDLKQKLNEAMLSMQGFTHDVDSIAKTTEQDSRNIRMLSLISIKFLPATFASTIFATDRITVDSISGVVSRDKSLRYYTAAFLLSILLCIIGILSGEYHQEPEGQLGEGRLLISLSDQHDSTVASYGTPHTVHPQIISLN